MHVGSVSQFCPTLTVNTNDKMEKVSQDKYLGGIVSDKYDNQKKVEYAKSKGISATSAIMGILNEVSFGHHYFEIAVLLRESLFINTILFNIETWYNITEHELNELESVDRILLRRIMNVPFSTPTALLYLELGIIPLRHIIQAKRIMFLRYIMTRQENDLLNKFLKAQIREPTKNDWCLTVKKDLETFDFDNDFEIVKDFSKETLSSEIKKSCRSKAFDDLLLKKEGYSKGNNLEYGELKMRSYLKSEFINSNDAKTIFKFRSRMLNVKNNFRGSHQNNLNCPLGCPNQIDSQIHLIFCQNNEKSSSVSEAEYNSLFGVNEEKMIPVIQKLNQILEDRNNQLLD